MSHGYTALMGASMKGHLAVVERLLEVGANPNQRSKNGITALMLASGHGHVAVVEALLAAGANVNKTDRYGATALLRARDNGHVDVVALLEDAAADRARHLKECHWKRDACRAVAQAVHGA